MWLSVSTTLVVSALLNSAAMSFPLDRAPMVRRSVVYRTRTPQDDTGACRHEQLLRHRGARHRRHTGPARETAWPGDTRRQRRQPLWADAAVHRPRATAA